MSLSNMFTVVLSCWLCFCFWTCSAETDDVEQLILRQKAFETLMMQDVAFVEKQLTKLEEEFKILSRSMQQSLPQNEISTQTNDQLSQTSIRLTKAFSDNKKAVAERISGISTHVSELEKQLRESIEETTAGRESILTTIAETVQEAQQGWSENLKERISGVRSELQTGISTIGKELEVDHNILIENVASIDDLNTSLAILEKQLRESVEETEESILTTIAETVQEAQQGWSENLEERISELENVTSTLVKELWVEHDILIETVARIDDRNTSLAILEKEILINRNMLTTNRASIDDLNNSLAKVITKLDKVWMPYNPRKPGDFIRLVGPERNMGRVEIFFYGQWGTVCDDLFDENNNGANVVCKMLGFSAGEVAKRFGSGSGPIWLDNVKCSGKEDTIHRCLKNQIGIHNCGHHEDVGVVCS